MKSKLIPKHQYKNHINQSNNIDTILNSYPEVSLDEEPWAREYFLNNPNVAGMAIGAGLNGVSGKRRVIVNPYNELMKDPIQRKGLLTNERLRHYMDETNFRLPNITQEQLNKYKETPYENDTLNIGRTEAARYLVNDKSNSLTNEQIKYINSYFNKKSNQKYRLGGIMKNKLLKYQSGGYTIQPDNTRVNSPMLVTPIKRKLKPGQVKVHGAIITPKNETVRKDTRTQIQRNNNQKEAQSAYKQYQKQKITEQGIKNTEGFVKMFSPSTYIGPMFRDNNKSYVENVMSGEGSGNNIGNIAIDILTPSISAQSYRVGRQLLNPAKRAAHAYVNISPAGYNDMGKRAKSWILDILKGSDADIEHPKWSLDEVGSLVEGYIPETVKNRKIIASQTRDDAWRIYNGLKPKYDMYIKNPDGTYSYNMDKIMEMSEGTFKPVLNMGSTPYDYITSAGGGLTRFENAVLSRQDFPSLNVDRTYGVQHIEDIWDLHPLSRQTDLISRRLPILESPFKAYNRITSHISGKIKGLSDNFKYDNKQIKNYLDKASEFELEMFDPEMFPRSQPFYNIGNAIKRVSDFISPSKQPQQYGPIRKLNEYGKTLEAGKILGGKPFKMSTDIPYTKSIKFPNKMKEITIPGNDEPIKIKPSAEIDYGFIPDEHLLLPSKVMLYKSGIKPSSFNFNQNINSDIVSNIINNNHTK